MAQFQSAGWIPGQYATVAASQTTKVLGLVGATGDYLEKLIVTGAGVITLFDGTTAILTFTGTTTPIWLEFRAYSKLGSWNVTTATGVSVIAVGQFT